MIWKQSPSIENLELSDSGLARNKTTGTIYRFSKDRRGYLKLNITKDSVQSYNYAHRLVCEAFHGSSKLTVDHINCIKDDNHAINLRWLPAAENLSIAMLGKLLSSEHRRKIRDSHSGSKAYHAKLTDGQVIEIKKKLLFGQSCVNIAREYGVARSIIQSIKSGRCYK